MIPRYLVPNNSRPPTRLNCQVGNFHEVVSQLTALWQCMMWLYIPGMSKWVCIWYQVHCCIAYLVSTIVLMCCVLCCVVCSVCDGRGREWWKKPQPRPPNVLLQNDGDHRPSTHASPKKKKKGTVTSVWYDGACRGAKYKSYRFWGSINSWRT